MRRLSILTCLLASAGMLIPTYAIAEEAGTYRPGQAYHSVIANSPMQCASQCQGDAQCKGWNFVRPRQMARTGVCEFNAQKVTPVPSPISISGDNETVRTSRQIVSAGSRTVRVGSSVVPAPSPQPVPAEQVQPSEPVYAAQTRRFQTPTTQPVRAYSANQALQTSPVMTMQRGNAGHQQAVAPQPPQMRIAHNLDEPDYNPSQGMMRQTVRHNSGQSRQAKLAGAQPAPRASQQSPVPPHMRIQHYLDGPSQIAAYQAPQPNGFTQPQMGAQTPALPAAESTPFMQHAPLQRTPVTIRHHLDDTAPRYEARRDMPHSPQNYQPPQNPESQNQPLQHQAPHYQAQQPTRQHFQQQTGAVTPQSAPQATPQITLYPHPITPQATAQAPSNGPGSLYGTLHDDVKAPLALTQQNTPNDVNTPIPTVRYIQVNPVSTAALPDPRGRW